jgi:ABC-2 type transport system permease protein
MIQRLSSSIEAADWPAPSLGQAELSAFGALFWLTVRQHVRGRRLLVLVVLFTLPAALAIIARYFNPSLAVKDLEFAIALTVLPHALVPLTALLYASGMIEDEIEDQTLTYLLVRPLPKWAVYIAKLIATVLVVSVLVIVFTLVTYAAIYAGATSLWSSGIPARAFKTAALFALALCAYCAIFGWVSLLVRRSLIVGAAYIILFEGLLANIPFVARSLTVMYYFRVLTERWTGQVINQWQTDLATAPSALTCVGVLSGATLVAAGAAAAWFSWREFRVKTPEGN